MKLNLALRVAQQILNYKQSNTVIYRAKNGHFMTCSRPTTGTYYTSRGEVWWEPQKFIEIFKNRETTPDGRRWQ
jgi:hypothetical protein